MTNPSPVLVTASEVPDDARRLVRYYPQNDMTAPEVVAAILSDPVIQTLMAAKLGPRMVTGLCEWSNADDESGPDYETSCGNAWSFTSGGITENALRFCPFCGEPVEELKPADEDTPTRGPDHG